VDAKDGKDDLASELQRALSQEGYYRGPIDGDIGSGSRAAIRAYQSDHGLEPTGRIDAALLHSLHIE
jgi:peptidoglycan hydrolase-like protein with peptidoglycan-binding domain